MKKLEVAMPRISDVQLAKWIETVEGLGKGGASGGWADAVYDLAEARKVIRKVLKVGGLPVSAQTRLEGLLPRGYQNGIRKKGE
jgi:hypothetical protein